MKGDNKGSKIFTEVKWKISQPEDETEVQEIIPEENGLEEISLPLNNDEKIVVDFVSDMDRDFGSSNREETRGSF
ncbi:hypothetical protein NWO25_00830 [Enterococcus lactis]|nr:hypothetical protein [Enterococcus lactis]